MKNKKLLQAVFMVVLFLSAFTLETNAQWTDWTKYGSTMSGQISAEYRTYYSRNYSPKVQWRIINNSSYTLQDAGIGRRSYELSDGKTSNYQPEGMRTIQPNEMATFYSDVVGDDGVRVERVILQYFDFKIDGRYRKVNF